jgi:putative DNA primase/helicase
MDNTPQNNSQGQATGKDFADAIRAEAEEKFNTPVSSSDLDADEFMADAALTDTGNAECFQNEHGKDYRYNINNNQWLRWNDVIWSEDQSSSIDAAILSVIRRRQRVATSAETSQISDKARVLNYLVRCENVRSRKDIKQAAQWLREFATTINQYDTDKYLASTLNGTLNLRDGSFYEAKRSDYISKQLGANYESDADCPRWKKFLNEIFDGNKELIRFMQKIVGYSLTGDVSEQKMFIFYGFGKNGKTVFINIISALFGDYAESASFKTFDADKQSENTNDLAMLNGRRFVSMIESAADKKLNEPLVKLTTGGDRISCRFLHKEYFHYVPQFKLFLATNHKPVITQTDFGIWRRIVLIPFNQNFEGREEDRLEETLKSELPGILNWALEGLKMWQAERLKPLPTAVTSATDKYKEESDTVKQWLDFQTIQIPQGAIKSSAAYTNYKDWSVENGYYPLGQKNFKSSLEERGFKQFRKMDAMYWIGFEFKSMQFM